MSALDEAAASAADGECLRVEVAEPLRRGESATPTQTVGRACYDRAAAGEHGVLEPLRCTHACFRFRSIVALCTRLGRRHSETENILLVPATGDKKRG